MNKSATFILKFAVQAQQATQEVAKTLAGIGNAAAKAQQAVSGLGQADAKTAAETARLTDATGKLRDAQGRFLAGQKRATDAIRQGGEASSAAAGRLDRLRGAANLAHRAMAAIGVTASAYAAVRLLTDTVRLNIDFEKGLVGVGKTADLAGKELDDLGQQVVDLSLRLPVAATELLTIAQAAGQLGVKGADNLLRFTETVAKLGAASDLSGEEAATALARLLNVTGESVGTVDKLASVIVALGNNTAATESEIARNATTVAQATAIFGVGSARAAAYGATLKELGIQAELSGGALGRAFRTLQTALIAGGREAQILAETTGMSIQELRRLFEEDAGAAFEAFISGLGRLRGGSAEMITTLEALGLTGEENLRVLPTLANSYERLGRNVNLANEEARNATALEEESRRGFETLGAAIFRVVNVVNGFRLKLQETNGTLRVLADAIGLTLGAILGVGKGAQQLTGPMRVLLEVTLALGTGFGALVALRLGQSLVGWAAGFSAVSAAVKALTAAIALNPIGLIAVAIGAAIVALFRFRKEIAAFVDDYLNFSVTIGEQTFKIGDIIRAFVEVTTEYTRRFLSDAWSFFKIFFNAVLDGVRQTFDIASRLVTGLLQFLTGNLLGGDSIWAKILQAIKLTGNASIAVIDGTVRAIRILIEQVAAALGALARFDVTSPIDSAERVFKALEKVGVGTASRIAAAFTDAFKTDYLGALSQRIEEMGSFIIATYRQATKEGLEGALKLILPDGLAADVAQRAREIALERGGQGQKEAIETALVSASDVITAFIGRIKFRLEQAFAGVGKIASFAGKDFGERFVRGAQAVIEATGPGGLMGSIARLGLDLGEGAGGAVNRALLGAGFEAAGRAGDRGALELRKQTAEAIDEEARNEAELQALRLQHGQELLELQKRIADARAQGRQDLVEEYQQEKQLLEAAQASEMAATRRQQAEKANQALVQEATRILKEKADAQREVNENLEELALLAERGEITHAQAAELGREAMEKYRAEVETMKGRVQDLAAETSDPQTRQKLIGWADEMGERMEDVGSKISVFTARVRDGLVNPLAELIKTSYRGAESLKEFGRAFLKLMADILAQRAAMSLLNGLFGSDTGGKDGGAKAGALTRFMNSLGGFFGFNAGGQVDGNVPVALTPGERIVPPGAVRKVGIPLLNALNRLSSPAGHDPHVVPGGGPDRDSVLARVARGSFVLRRAANQALGAYGAMLSLGTASPDILRRLQGFNLGGLVDVTPAQWLNLGGVVSPAAVGAVGLAGAASPGRNATPPAGLRRELQIVPWVMTREQSERFYHDSSRSLEEALVRKAGAIRAANNRRA